MNYSNEHFEKIFFLLGFFSALPFFFITVAPFVHINYFYNDTIWNDRLGNYPGYTDSLYNLHGLSFPFVLGFLFVYFLFNFFFCKKKENINFKLNIACGILVIINALALYVLSSSIKSLSASASLLGLYMILVLINDDYFKTYSKAFIISLLIFINLHAFSILLNGINISYSIHGTSFFDVEIYQSLVSYTLVVSFFFSTLILKKEIFYNLFNFKDIKVKNTLYFVTLLSCFIIIIIHTRRFSFFICLISLCIWFLTYINKNNFKLNLKKIFLLIIQFALLFIAIKAYFVDERSINYANMIKPRLESITLRLSELFNSNSVDLFFGKFTGWGNIESGILNMISNTGLIGFFTYFFVLMILVYQIFKKINFFILKKNLIYIFFSFFTLLFSNFINNSISTPYFFISFFIIMITIICAEKNKT